MIYVTGALVLIALMGWWSAIRKAKKNERLRQALDTERGANDDLLKQLKDLQQRYKKLVAKTAEDVTTDDLNDLNN